MATSKKNKLKFQISFKKFFSFPISPRRQFRRLAVVMALLFVAVVSFHVYFFYNTESYDTNGLSSAPTTPGPTVNQKKLTSVLARYQDKETARTNALTITPPVIEPSS